MKTIDTLLVENTSLFWDIANLQKLDTLAIEERFLQYWDWENIKNIESIYGKDALKKDYILLRDKKRSHFSKKTINFFNLYFHV